MSYAICRVQKIGSGSAVAGIQIHNRRERTHSNTNPDIDYTRCNDNYDLLNTPNKSYNTLVNECIKQGYSGKKAIRKDAVRMCEVLFTSDGEFFNKISSEQQHKYFQDCYQFACNRYGKQNIIAATVHLDEDTPHMHLDFVPITADGRLSAKSVLGGRFDLQNLQDEFFNIVGSKYGLERGKRADIENIADKPRTHKTVSELKRETTQELENIKTNINALKMHENELQGKVMNLQEVNALNGKRSLTGGLKGISYTEYLSLKKTAEKVDTIDLRERNLTEREQKIAVQEANILAEENNIALKRSEMASTVHEGELRVQDLSAEENAIRGLIERLNAEYQKIRKNRDIFRDDLLRMTTKHDEERYFYYETTNQEITDMILGELKDKKIMFSCNKYTGNETTYKLKIPRSECFWTNEIFEKAKEIELENENRFQGFSR